jgi:hypothetical protein
MTAATATTPTAQRFTPATQFLTTSDRRVSFVHTRCTLLAGREARAPCEDRHHDKDRRTDP